MPLEIVRQDITKMAVDAIVNTANPRPVVGGGVDRAIHQAAGPKLFKARREIGALAIGQAVHTEAYELPAHFVIHTVGPVWQDGHHHEAEQLAACYRNALTLARKLKAESIAFPLIATGTYGFPKDQALAIALREISAFLLEHDMMVYLVLFDHASFHLSKQLFHAIQSYVDDHYIEQALSEEYDVSDDRGQLARQYRNRCQEDVCYGSCADGPCEAGAPPRMAAPSIDQSRADLSAKLSELAAIEPTWSEALLTRMDATGEKDAAIYKRANVDRKLFSKIRSRKDYQPSKRTALAFAIALRLTLDETRTFLRHAGYALTQSSKQDIIVAFCIEHGIYDINEVNMALFDFGQPLLGK